MPLLRWKKSTAGPFVVSRSRPVHLRKHLRPAHSVLFEGLLRQEMNLQVVREIRCSWVARCRFHGRTSSQRSSSPSSPRVEYLLAKDDSSRHVDVAMVSEEVEDWRRPKLSRKGKWPIVTRSKVTLVLLIWLFSKTHSLLFTSGRRFHLHYQFIALCLCDVVCRETVLFNVVGVHILHITYSTVLLMRVFIDCESAFQSRVITCNHRESRPPIYSC